MLADHNDIVMVLCFSLDSVLLRFLEHDSFLWGVQAAAEGFVIQAPLLHGFSSRTISSSTVHSRLVLRIAGGGVA